MGGPGAPGPELEFGGPELVFDSISYVGSGVCTLTSSRRTWLQGKPRHGLEGTGTGEGFI